MEGYSYGMIGLGTMGSNLVMNMSDKGFSVAGYDKDTAQVQLMNAQHSKNVKAFDTIEAFVAALNTPRIIMLLVPAGPIVDAVVFELKRMLSENDLIIDCGNSHFADTQKRTDKLLQEGLHFMGLGVSGGETGARFGPSIMPGGDKKAYGYIAPMLESIAAKVDGTPCVAWMGNGAAGHYVKMVHNGIEYAIMQLIAETYHMLKVHAGLSDIEIHEVFKKWNEGRLKSFLIEITAAIFLQEDDKNGKLINMITDTAHQKGTGAWMSKDAMDIQQPIPSIDAAVSQRAISAMKKQRVLAAEKTQRKPISASNKPQEVTRMLEDALYFSMITAYAQGFSMLKHASVIYHYDIDLSTVATVWRGGCIIRAAMLEDMREAFMQTPDIENLLLVNKFSDMLGSLHNPLRQVITAGVQNGIPMPAFSATLSYYDSYHSAWLPANLVQAQRDFFGAHTYERLDQPGVFHTNWNQKVQ